MAERKRNWDKEDDLPVYLARPGTTDQVPRQKYGGMFCNVEGAYESKTIDFDALSVGQRSSRAAKVADKKEGSKEETSPDSERCSPGTERQQRDSGIEIKTTGGKEVLQNLDDLNVSSSTFKSFNRHHIKWKNCIFTSHIL